MKAILMAIVNNTAGIAQSLINPLFSAINIVLNKLDVTLVLMALIKEI